MNETFVKTCYASEGRGPVVKRVDDALLRINRSAVLSVDRTCYAIHWKVTFP